MAFTTQVTVRFGDVDRAGIVYFPVIFHYLHIAQEDFFANYVGIPYHQLLDEHRVGFPTVSDSSRFLKPIKYGDTLVISILISHVGRSSVTFEYQVRRETSGELLAESSETKVAVSTDTWQKIDIPDRCREAFLSCREE